MFVTSLGAADHGNYFSIPRRWNEIWSNKNNFTITPSYSSQITYFAHQLNKAVELSVVSDAKGSLKAADIFPIWMKLAGMLSVCFDTPG